MTRVVAEIVIAVHDPARPIERAVASVLRSEGAAAVVAVHNTPVAAIRARLGALADDPRVRLIEVADGIRSPSGPFNAGIDAAVAPYVGIMGSDDELEPGAVDSWLALAERTGAKVVIARTAHAVPRRGIRTPPVRVPSRRLLDPVRDRLVYRSAPLGIWDRARFDIRFPAGLAAGEDLPFTIRLWFSGERIAFDATGPAYLVHADAPSRVSLSTRPVADDTAYLPSVRAAAEAAGLSGPERDSLVRKLLRVHIFGLISNRGEAQWDADDRAGLTAATVEVLSLGERPLHSLSRAERSLVDAIMDDAPISEVYARHAATRRATRPAALVPRNPFRLFARDAPLRFAAASLWVARRRQR